MTTKKTFLAGLLALSLPLTAIAQAAPAAAPAAAPTADGVKFTPYGFILANAFFTGGSMTDQDYPGWATAAVQGGSVLMSARQSRIGFRLATKDDWSGADLAGTLEFDFSGGHTIAVSTAWYNGLMRLRVASMTASWKTSAGNISVLAGQDAGIVNTLFAESLAWVAKPLFWQAGNLWRRSPQFRVSYANNFGDIGFNAAVALLSPATLTPVSGPGTTAAVDMGAGNQSRMPNIEARVGANAKFAQDISAAVGLGYHQNTRRMNYYSGAGTNNQQDVTGSLIGLDLDLGLTSLLQVKGEFYTGSGADDTYNAIGAPTYNQAGAPAGTGVKALKSSGFWAQAIIKPLPWFWVTAGLGHGEADKATSANNARIKSDQLAGGLIFNAGKAWRFGIEAAQVKTEFLTAAGGTATTKQDATQVAVSSQLKF